jgi:hypothetical protein
MHAGLLPPVTEFPAREISSTMKPKDRVAMPR